MKHLRPCVFVMLLMGFASPSLARAPMCHVPKATPQRGPSSETTRGTPEIKIIQLDPDMPLQELELEGYEVVPFDEFVNTDPWTAPDPVLREQMFSAAGISPHVRGWDHLKRDMLFLRAQEQGLEVLKRKYPEIPAKALQSLIRIIGEEKKRRGKK